MAQIIEARDDDYTLAARHFRRFALGAHPYGRSVVGTTASVNAIKRTDLVEHYSRHFLKSNLIIGAAGAVTADRLAAPGWRNPSAHVRFRLPPFFCRH